MADYNNLLARAQLIKNETETSANTAERVGQLLEDIINAMAAGDNDRKTIRQVYDAQQRLQVLFEVNGQCVIRYSATVNGRSWSDELYYASTQYPNEGTFYTLTRRDFIESRFDGTPRGVCIAPKAVAAAPAIEYTFEVVYLRGSITWHNGDLFRTPSTNDILCAKLSTTEDVSAAINLSTSAQGYIYTDQSALVEALADNTLYTMNASASGGAFTIPARSDYSGTSIFCYGDGVATLNGTNYAYTSGQTLLLVGGVVHVEDTVSDSYTREETDEQLDEIRESLSTVYKYKGSCSFANLPTTNRKVGDTYNVTNAFTIDGVTYPAGTNVSWTGTEWDALAGDSSNKEDKGNKVTSLSASSTDTQYPSAKCVHDELTGKADDNGVVHKTGDESVDGWKTLRTGIVIGNSGFIRFAPPGTASASISGGTANTLFVEGGGIIAYSGNILNNESRLVTGGKVYTVLLDYQTLANLVTALSSSSTDTQYASAKCVYDALTGKANDTAVVHISGEENITGRKNYVYNGIAFTIKRTSDATTNLSLLIDTDGHPNLRRYDNSSVSQNVLLKSDRIEFKDNLSQVNAYVSSNSNLNKDWNTNQLPAKTAVAKYVAGQIAGKANDNSVVHNNGDETIAGVKSFTSTMQFGSGRSAIDLVKNGSAMELQKASIFRLQRVYTNSERHIQLDVYGSTDDNATYPRLVARKRDLSGDEPATTETTSVALRDDKVSFALARTTEWGFVNATSNSDSNWTTKEMPTKNAVKALVDSHITDIVITLD